MAIHRTNPEWLNDLGTQGAAQTEALEDLRQILLVAAQKTFSHFLGDLPAFPQEAIVSLSEDCAQEALISVLDHLKEFHGDSKFSTWAYKFSVNISLRTARRERQRFLSQEPKREEPGSDDWELLKVSKVSPGNEESALQKEIWAVIRTTIQNELTPRQREVLRLMVFNEVPMDEVVERLKTNRNAGYKMLHDARQKIKTRLLAKGIKVEDALRIFGKED
jgi:RNA polymerase sigma-70 factor, ECF subfamily